jgi:hypothetical protein
VIEIKILQDQNILEYKEKTSKNILLIYCKNVTIVAAKNSVG